MPPLACSIVRFEGRLARLIAGGVALWVAFAMARAAETSAPPDPRWPVEKAWRWYLDQPWLVGCNFVPSTAVNDVEMWQADTFDPATIGRELGWAHDLGFNTVRVFLNFAVWEADPAGFLDRFERFLRLADERAIRAMPILFDDCFKPEPVVGRQADPEPGVHNSQWVQSPGARRRGDRTAWASLERYVTNVVGRFATDRRIVMWDLYNEPSQSPELVAETFRWAREAKPAQPLTSCWLGVEHSDVLSFHAYGDLPATREEIEKLQPNRRGRPYVCTEWMARAQGSRFATHLPWFKAQQIGCWNWGLVAGRTQTYFPWGSAPGSPEPTNWFHDVLRRDGRPYDAAEVHLIRRTTGAIPPPDWQEIVPTAESKSVTWRYTFEPPAADWHRDAFDDSGWRTGAAPFGFEEENIGRRPRTVWTNSEIWMRRTCQAPPGPFRSLGLRLHHDEDVEVYLNGIRVFERRGYNARYEDVELGPEAMGAMKAGLNRLAVHCRQTGGGQFVDVGLVADRPPLPLRKLLDTPMRDPSICQAPDGTWYLTGTSEPFWNYNEGIRVWRSPDLTNWTALGMVWRYGESPWHKKYREANKPLWAPEIHHLKGTFWLTYSLPGWDGTGKTSGCGLLKSTSGKAEGPYVDMHPAERLGDEIDASLFQDDDGAVYFLWHSGKIARLTADLSGLDGPYRWLKTTGTDANPKHHSGLCAGIFGADSFDHVGYEGMFIFKANGRYYLCCAEHFDGRYSCTVAMADALMGPYGPRYEALPHVGHNVVVRGRDGRWWSTYFGSDAGAPWQERPGLLPVAFDAAGRLRPRYAVE